MKKLFFFALLLLGVQQVAIAQQAKHQIVFQLVTADTMAHKAFMKQLNNIYTVSPESIVKVVVHGPGIDMYTASKSVVGTQLQKAVERGVVFEVCVRIFAGDAFHHGGVRQEDTVVLVLPAEAGALAAELAGDDKGNVINAHGLADGIDRPEELIGGFAADHGHFGGAADLPFGEHGA